MLKTIRFFQRHLIVLLVPFAIALFSGCSCNNCAVPAFRPTPPGGGATPPGVISCASSGTGAIGVLCASGKTYAFVGKGLAGGTSVEQVDISGGASGGGTGHVSHTYTSGTGTAYTECSSDEGHQRVLCGAFTKAELMDIAASGGAGTSTEFSSGATGSLSFSGGSCTICAIAYDPIDNAFILMDPDPTDPAMVRGRFQRLGENSHTIDRTIISPDPNENPGYDYVKNWIFNPEYQNAVTTVALEVANFSDGKLYTTSTKYPAISTPDSGSVDVATHVAITPNEFGDVVTLADLGTATLSGSTLTVATGMATLTHTGDESLDNDATAMDSVLHVTFLAGEFGTNHLGFVSMPTTSTGTSISDYAYAKFPNTPDGVAWSSAHDPHPITAFNDPVNCNDCGISVNLAFTWMAVVDLKALTHAPRASGDVHTIDPTYDLIAHHVLAYYKI